MQNIEPFYNWRHLYVAEDDPKSAFFGKIYSEFEYSETLYNYYIHPQWDNFGSKTLYLKIIFVDYEMRLAIIELIGEWNDAIENDIMTLRRNITDEMNEYGICYFVLITENVLNFHSSDDSYYEDWMDQLTDENGWVVLLNMTEQSKYDFRKARLTNYIQLMELIQWRTLKPEVIFNLLDAEIRKQLY